MNTLYWHDYETWGEVPAADKPCQFAGLRTDENLNVIGEPLVFYCKPAADVLPKPIACLITGITPQQALAEGVSEHEFIATIHEELAKPGTCGVGYNTLRFDDEVTRYALYRNFYDPYEREWQNGNSRWDIIDMVRLVYALRPEGIEWPLHESGKPSFKLEHLCAINGLMHESAHDALSDVQATIALAKLIRERQPKLYDYVYTLRQKNRAKAMLDLENRKPVLYISSMFPAEQGCAAIIAPIAVHPVNKNAVIAFDLSVDPEPLAQMGVEQIRERLFTRREDLPEGVERLPLMLVHVNKCPVLVTPKMVDEAAAKRLKLDPAKVQKNWRRLQQMDIAKKLQQVYKAQEFAPRNDPEQQLYDGFFSPQDKQAMYAIRNATPTELAANKFTFKDKRLPELLFRYRARNFPESLSSEEVQRWQEHCYQRVTSADAGGSITLQDYYQTLDAMRLEAGDERQNKIVAALLEYGDKLL